jgi:hypothetical protein
MKAVRGTIISSSPGNPPGAHVLFRIRQLRQFTVTPEEPQSGGEDADVCGFFSFWTKRAFSYLSTKAYVLFI